ncbi:hypothetical protein D3C87_2207090 [compost metagenome]
MNIDAEKKTVTDSAIQRRPFRSAAISRRMLLCSSFLSFGRIAIRPAMVTMPMTVTTQKVERQP